MGCGRRDNSASSAVVVATPWLPIVTAVRSDRCAGTCTANHDECKHSQTHTHTHTRRTQQTQSVNTPHIATPTSHAALEHARRSAVAQTPGLAEVRCWLVPRTTGLDGWRRSASTALPAHHTTHAARLRRRGHRAAARRPRLPWPRPRPGCRQPPETRCAARWKGRR